MDITSSCYDGDSSIVACFSTDLNNVSSSSPCRKPLLVGEDERWDLTEEGFCSVTAVRVVVCPMCSIQVLILIKS